MQLASLLPVPLEQGGYYLEQYLFCEMGAIFLSLPSPCHAIACCFMSELERDAKTGASFQALLPLRGIPLPCVAVQLQFHQHNAQLLDDISQSNSPCLYAPYLHLHAWFGAPGLPLLELFCCLEAPCGELSELPALELQLQGSHKGKNHKEMKDIILSGTDWQTVL